MKDRIKLIRKNAKLNQTEFAEKIGLSRIHVAQVEIDQGTFSDRTIKDICRIFNVNEEWLRTGTGDMYDEPADDIAAAVSDLLEDPENELNALILKTLKEYAKLDDKSKKVVDDLIKRILDN